jgi:4-carboxymuconolactone decarboxylase
VTDEQQRPWEGSDAWKRGQEIRYETLGEYGEERKRLFQSFHPELMRFPIEFVFGTILSRPGLDMKTREMITLVIAISTGKLREIRSHTRGFLNAGGTKEEVVEILLQIAPYAGFPTYIEGVYGVLEVFEERGLWTRPSKEELAGSAAPASGGTGQAG